MKTMVKKKPSRQLLRVSVPLRIFGVLGAVCTMLATPLRADSSDPETLVANEAACTTNSAKACYLYGSGLLGLAIRADLARGASDERLQELIKSGTFPNMMAARIAAKMPAHKAQFLNQESFDYREKGCVLGWTYACEELGYAYRYGHQTAVDNARALAFFEKACETDNSVCSKRDEVLALVQPPARQPNYAEAGQSYESPAIDGCNEQARNNAVRAANNLQSSISRRVSLYQSKLSEVERYSSTLSGSNYYRDEVNKLRSIKEGLVNDITAFLNTHGSCISDNDYSSFSSLRSSFQ